MSQQSEKQLRRYALPAAIVLGILFHRFLSSFYSLMPLMLAVMMGRTCSRTSVSEMRIRPVHLLLLSIQVFAGVGIYFAFRRVSEPLAQGLMICIFTPVATSSPVVGLMLGADITLMTTYVLLSNFTAAVLAPFFFSYINISAVPFWDSFLHIISRTLLLLVVPLVLSWITERRAPQVHRTIARYSTLSFYIWAVCMMILIGSTINTIMSDAQADIMMYVIMALSSLVLCILLFRLGARLGKRYGDVAALRQMTGQKNTGIGIWMTLSFLNPLAAVVPAAYIIWQNSINSIEIAKS